MLYCGPKSGSELADIIKSCDLMLHPAFADPSPNAVSEALACGLPVFAHPYSGAAELVEKFGGKNINWSWYSVVGRDPDRLPDMLTEVIHKSKPYVMSSRVQTIEKMANEYIELFENVTQNYEQK